MLYAFGLKLSDMSHDSDSLASVAPMIEKEAQLHAIHIVSTINVSTLNAHTHTHI